MYAFLSWNITTFRTVEEAQFDKEKDGQINHHEDGRDPHDIA